MGELTSVTTEDLLINNGSNGKAVEAVSEGLPQLNIVPTLTCIKRLLQIWNFNCTLIDFYSAQPHVNDEWITLYNIQCTMYTLHNTHYTDGLLNAEFLVPSFWEITVMFLRRYYIYKTTVIIWINSLQIYRFVQCGTHCASYLYFL